MGSHATLALALGALVTLALCMLQRWLTQKREARIARGVDRAHAQYLAARRRQSDTR